MYNCEQCGKPVPDYEPQFCCNGQDCGCLGLPIEPCLCDDCWNNLFNSTITNKGEINNGIRNTKRKTKKDQKS